MQAGFLQAFAQLLFGSRVAHDAQGEGRALLDQQVFTLLAHRQVALVIEGQGGAVLGLLVHAAFTRIEMHAHQAAKAEHRAGVQRIQALFAHLWAADDQRREVNTLLLLGLQGEQGAGDVLTVKTHRATAVAGYAPALAIGVQGDALLIGLAAGAPATGQQGVVFEAEQTAAALLGIALAALQIAHAKFRAPVFQAQTVDIQSH